MISEFDVISIVHYSIGYLRLVDTRALGGNNDFNGWDLAHSLLNQYYLIKKNGELTDRKEERT